MAKRDWQQDQSARGQPTVAGVVSNSSTVWRGTRQTGRERLRSQSRLLRTPLLLGILMGLCWLVVHVVGWFQPIQKPRLTVISSRYHAIAMPLNACAAHDAAALVKLDRVFNASEAKSKSLSAEEIRGVVQQLTGPGVESTLIDLFGWRSTTEFVYVNAIGVAFASDDSQSLVPYLLGDDFNPAADSDVAIVPVADLLEALAASGADNKVLVLDCQRISSWWPRGIIQNQFVKSVKHLVGSRPEKYGRLRILFSTGDHEVSHTDWGNSHSVFGRHMLTGLAGEADANTGNHDGRVTVAELSTYLQMRVGNWVNRNLGQSQTCQMQPGSDREELILTLVDAHTSPTDALISLDDSTTRDTDLDEIAEAWQSYYELSAASPHPVRYSPVHWHVLELSLLRAEDHLCCRQPEAMRTQLEQARHLVTDIIRAGLNVECSRSWSLAMNRQFGHGQSTAASKPIASVPMPLSDTVGEVNIPAPEPAPTASSAETTDNTEGAETKTGKAADIPSQPRPDAKPPALEPPVSRVDAESLVTDVVNGSISVSNAGEILQQLHQNGPTPVEFELLRVLAQNTPIFSSESDARRWEDEVRSLIASRIRLERAAVPAGDLAPEIFRWLQADIQDLDVRQRMAEDNHFGFMGQSVVTQGHSEARSTRTGKRPGPPALSENESTAHAEMLAGAVVVRQRVLAELPWLIEAASEFTGSDEHSKRVAEIVRLLDATLSLCREVGIDPSTLKRSARHQRIAAIDGAVAELITVRREVLNQIYSKATAILHSGNADSPAAWQALSMARKLPFPSDSRTKPVELASWRRELLKTLISFKATEPSSDVSPQATHEISTADLKQRANLAHSWLAISESDSTNEPELSPDGYSAPIERRFQSALQRASKPDANAAYPELFAADSACRIARHMASVDLSRANDWAAGRFHRRNRGDYFAFVASRRMEDFWAGRSPDVQSWFAQAAEYYLSAARRADPFENEAIDAARERLLELKQIADRFLASGSDDRILQTNRDIIEFRGIDRQVVDFHYQPSDQWPKGLAQLAARVSDPGMLVRPASTSNASHLHAFELVRMHPSGGRSVLAASLFFRGHQLRRTIPVKKVDESTVPTVVYESNPSKQGEFVVRWSSVRPKSSSILFVIDASNSMSAPLSLVEPARGNRMSAVQDILLQYAHAVADSGVSVGIRVIGDSVAWTSENADDRILAEQARRDTRLVLPIQPFVGSQFAAAIESLQPLGSTPLFRALLEARRDFDPNSDGDKTIVVISDGIDNWAAAGRTPGLADIRSAFEGSGIRINTIGFQTPLLRRTDRGYRQLEQIAEATAGNSIRVNDSDKLLRSLFGLSGFRQYSITGEASPLPVYTGTLGYGTEAISVEPGRYAVRVFDRDNRTIAARPGITIDSGQCHELVYSGKTLTYQPINTSSDLAFKFDEASETLLRVINAEVNPNGLEISVALLRETQPAWQPRDVQLRIKPRNGREVYTVQGLRANLTGVHYPAWKFRLANWPADAKFADIEASWFENNGTRPRYTLSLNNLEGDKTLPEGIELTRRHLGPASIDGTDRNVATITLTLPNQTPDVTDWSIRFPNPITFARKVYNQESRIQTGQFEFPEGQSPEAFFVEGPVFSASRSAVQITVGLRLRTIN